MPSQGSIQITIDHTWPTGDYHISLESPQAYGKTQTGRGSQPYIYGMTGRFSVLYTAGSLFLREPREMAEWKFDQEHQIKWTAEDFNGGESIAATVTDPQGNIHQLGSIQQRANGGELTVLPLATWGEGTITVRIFLAENDAIFATRAVKLAAPAAYFEITEPNGMKIFVFDIYFSLAISRKSIGSFNNKKSRWYCSCHGLVNGQHGEYCMDSAPRRSKCRSAHSRDR